jgi:hypothetical protein
MAVSRWPRNIKFFPYNSGSFYSSLVSPSIIPVQYFNTTHLLFLAEPMEYRVDASPIIPRKIRAGRAINEGMKVGKGDPADALDSPVFANQRPRQSSHQCPGIMRRFKSAMIQRVPIAINTPTTAAKASVRMRSRDSALSRNCRK